MSLLSGSTPPDPHRWMAVQCTCVHPSWAHEDDCTRGKAIRECASEDYKREKTINLPEVDEL